jgi:hypothetical protein
MSLQLTVACLWALDHMSSVFSLYQVMLFVLQVHCAFPWSTNDLCSYSSCFLSTFLSSISVEFWYDILVWPITCRFDRILIYIWTLWECWFFLFPALQILQGLRQGLLKLLRSSPFNFCKQTTAQKLSARTSAPDFLWESLFCEATGIFSRWGTDKTSRNFDTRFNMLHMIIWSVFQNFMK